MGKQLQGRAQSKKKRCASPISRAPTGGRALADIFIRCRKMCYGSISRPKFWKRERQITWSWQTEKRPRYWLTLGRLIPPKFDANNPDDNLSAFSKSPPPSASLPPPSSNFQFFNIKLPSLLPGQLIFFFKWSISVISFVLKSPVASCQVIFNEISLNISLYWCRTCR